MSCHPLSEIFLRVNDVFSTSGGIVAESVLVSPARCSIQLSVLTGVPFQVDPCPILRLTLDTKG